MSAVARDNYDYLKNQILNPRNSVNEQNLIVLKRRYENEINSPRQFSQINTLAQLINVLEKRNCVSENDVSILEEIAKDMGNYQFLAEINNIRRNEAGERNLLPIVSTSNPSNQSHISPITGVFNIKQKIHDVIANEIGNKWIDFARALDLAEGKIDEHKIQNNNNTEVCARAVLNYHEHNVHEREWKTRLLEALEKARRNDLKKKVCKIFDDYS